jgi:heme exporter protein B
MRSLSRFGMFRWLVWREITLTWRRRSDAVAVLFFLALVVSLFPLAVAPDSALLLSIASGVVWVATLLASTMSLSRLFSEDYADGTLEQLLLMPQPAYAIVLGKVLAHWLVLAVPMTLLAPVLAVQFGLPGGTPLVLAASLVLGTPTILLIGSVGAALTLGVRGAATLTSLLVMPLYIPTLVFGAGAAQASLAGASPAAHMRLLGAMLILALVFAPWAASAALKVSLE